jgi:hypothetical protein
MQEPDSGVDYHFREPCLEQICNLAKLDSKMPQETLSDNFTDEQIIDLSATQLAQLIRKRVVTSEQVTRAFLRRIEEVNPKINAIVERNPRAIEDAKVSGQLHVLLLTLSYSTKSF